MQYCSFTYVDENVYEKTVCNITILHTFDENVYITTVCNIIAVVHTVDENVYNTTVCNVAVLHTLGRKCIYNDSVQYCSFTYLLMNMYIKRQCAM